MSTDEGRLVLDMAERLFSEQCSPEVVSAAERGWPVGLWRFIQESGLLLALVPADDEGVELELADVLDVVAGAAGHAVPLPLGETMLAAAAIAQAGLAIPSGPLSLACGAPGRLVLDEQRVTLTGVADRVPWGRDLAAVGVLARSEQGSFLCVIRSGAFRVETHRNLAFEPRDTLTFHSADVLAYARLPDEEGETIALKFALLRAAQINGALRATLELSVQYANERVQFGRAISRFQAVSGLLAELSMEAAAAAAAVNAAVDVVHDVGWDGAAGSIAVAKIRCGQAATVAAERAHQVHGAIGTTREHRLQLLTRRLWSWRDEYGTEQQWAVRLGRRALDAGTEGAWKFTTGLV